MMKRQAKRKPVKPSCPRCAQIDAMLASLETAEGRKQLVEMFQALRKHFSRQLKSKR